MMEVHAGRLGQKVTLIVGAGPNSRAALRQADRKIVDGDIVVLDVGAGIRLRHGIPRAASANKVTPRQRDLFHVSRRMPRLLRRAPVRKGDTGAYKVS
jgi:Xaa-Pro aminopeptidase